MRPHSFVQSFGLREWGLLGPNLGEAGVHGPSQNLRKFKVECTTSTYGFPNCTGNPRAGNLMFTCHSFRFTHKKNRQGSLQGDSPSTLRFIPKPQALLPRPSCSEDDECFPATVSAGLCLAVLESLRMLLWSRGVQGFAVLRPSEGFGAWYLQLEVGAEELNLAGRGRAA